MAPRKTLALLGLSVLGGVYVISNPENSRPKFDDARAPPLKFAKQPTRRECLGWLRNHGGASDAALDVLIVGGGATGCAVALDAVTRGFNVGLVEADDYASGTSSRSTKLVHGGVRYLEKAVYGLDKEQYKLVAEALRERAVMIHQAPHLCHPLATMIPCYDPIEVVMYWAGMKLYDLIGAVHRGTLDFSFFQLPVRSLNQYPRLTHEESTYRQVLLGGVVYYDGQMDDARFCVSAALTAASYGAAVTNHTSLESIATIKDAKGEEMLQATVLDRISGKRFSVRTRCIVNAGGPFSDQVRKLCGDTRGDRMIASAGTHITLPADYCPKNSAMLVPSQDGRVTFAIPWLGSCIVGTTDTPTTLTTTPRGTKKDVEDIIASLQRFIGKIDPKDVKSVWCGIRPLAQRLPPATAEAPEGKPAAAAAQAAPSGTQGVVREHHVDVDAQHRVVSITGGKWTTARKMAEDVVDALAASGLVPSGNNRGPCVTENVRLVGAQTSLDTVVLPETLQISEAVRQRWTTAFGDRAPLIAEEANRNASRWYSKGSPAAESCVPLAAAQSITEAEIRYCALNEHCETISDYLQRRSRLAFLDIAEAVAAVPKVADVMGGALGWSGKEKQAAIAAALISLQQFTIAGSPELKVPK